MSIVHSQDRRPGSAEAEGEERRSVGSPRVPYEALVEVGAGSVGGFEAESVDVSPDGMRLRTAYLPQPGETLVCRFDGFGGEVVVEGQVSWCRSESRGGEFGVQFTNLDARAAELLGSMCVHELDDEVAEQPVESQGSLPGARVRLHIQGLGSPMRARIRDVARGEVLIGSNLEFLQVGRDVELENVERGESKVAQIDNVEVSVDPETQIPQLIVALRFDQAPESVAEEIPDSADAVTAPIQPGVSPARAAAVAMKAERETTPEPQVIDQQAEGGDTPVSGEPYGPAPEHYEAQVEAYTPEGSPVEYTPASASELHYTPAPASAGELEAMEESVLPEPVAETKTSAAAERLQGAKERAGKIARKITPALSAAGAGAKSALGGIFARVRAKQQQSKATRQGKARRAPVRTTAPPPSGALRSDGKRLFRESHAPASTPAPTPVVKKANRKRAIFGAVVGVVAVVGIYLVAGQVSDWQRAQDLPPPALAANTPAASEADPAAAVPQPGSTIATADVPLFGATPLSTTEPVPVPPNVEIEEEGEPGAKKPMMLDKEWGVGSIEDPTVLRIKMDGPIEGIAGAEGATGFTLVIPKRKSISSAAGLARKDKRIESVNVVNYPDRAEITVHFKKGEVPAFLAKAKGNRLIIEVGAEQKGKKSKRKKKSSTKKRSKSKKRSGKKKD